MSDPHRYLLAFGSNMRHARYGPPPAVLGAAIGSLEREGVPVVARSRIIDSKPLGPSRRRYANAAVLVETRLAPPALLALAKRLERDFGRRPSRRWAARVLDIDIVLWSGGSWRSPGLTIPHPEFRRRSFVLLPARSIAARWRDPVTGLTIAHLAARLTRPLPTPTPRPARALSSVGRATDF